MSGQVPVGGNGPLMDANGREGVEALSDTPRTDAAQVDVIWHYNRHDDCDHTYTKTEEAKKLERELSAAIQTIETLEIRHAAAMLHAKTNADEYNAVLNELDAIKVRAAYSEQREADLAKKCHEAREFLCWALDNVVASVRASDKFQRARKAAGLEAAS